VDVNDLKWMRMAFAVARRARDKGNRPFAAVLVDGQGQLLMEAHNTVLENDDCTAHAEANLLSQATRTYDRDFLATCTIYCSAEPCPMCAGAIYWANLRRVVYGLSQERLYELDARDEEEMLRLPCRAVLDRGQKSIQVLGPILEDEAQEVLQGV
jgi:tRNA(Arg) A34 adenosine deaminase TadA